jgi:CRISPR-associated protein Csx10
MIDVVVRAQQRLHLGIRPDSGWISDGHPFVPGSVLRGALAAAWIAEQEPDLVPGNDPQFRSLFEGVVRFGPLFTDPRCLRPMSVFSCKYPSTPTCGTSTYDAAFAEDPPGECSCGAPLEQSKGQVDGAIVERTQVQMEPRDDVAAVGGLFSRRAIPAGTELRGHIAGTHPWLTADPVRLVRLGGRRSTAGLAEVSLSTARTQPDHDSLDRERGLLVIRLLSPAIFVDGWGRPGWRPDTERLARTLGVPVDIAAEWVRPVAVGGWHVVSNLPKSREFAVAAGSVYLLRLGDEPDNHRVQQLWQDGIGIRRTEGFGWISLDRWQPAPPPAIQHADTEAGPDPDADRLTTLLRLRLTDFVLTELRRRHTHGGQTPTTRRLAGLSAEARDFVEAILGLDPDHQRRLASRLDAISREMSR